tara:strand:+ start:39 stop:632 length:594 start_codon:yes stop_codon:yes gene_type:complete
MDLGLAFAFFVIAAMFILLIRLPFMVKFVEPIEDEDKPLSPVMRTLIEWGIVKQTTDKEKVNPFQRGDFDELIGMFVFLIILIWYLFPTAMDIFDEGYVMQSILPIVVLLLFIRTLLAVTERIWHTKFPNKTILSNIFESILTFSVVMFSFWGFICVYGEVITGFEAFVMKYFLPSFVLGLLVSTVFDVIRRNDEEE